MARVALELPAQLKQEAALLANQEGVSLEQFILAAISEKVEHTKPQDDPAHPLITYRRGASGISQPVIRGTGIRVQTIVIEYKTWGISVEEIAEDRDLSKEQVQAALDFYQTHQMEIDHHIALEEEIAARYEQTALAS